MAFAQADPIQLASGLNRLTTRLLATVLINTLIDNITGQPIANVPGSIDVYSGTTMLEQQPFRTNASGVYTTTFQHLISQDVRLSYRVASYAQQFYDRARTLDRATGVRLASGITRLTSRLLPPTVLVDAMTSTALPGRNRTAVYTRKVVPRIVMKAEMSRPIT